MFHLETGTLHHNYQQPKLSGTGLRGVLGVVVVPYPPYMPSNVFGSGFEGWERVYSWVGERTSWAYGRPCRAGGCVLGDGQRS